MVNFDKAIPPGGEGKIRLSMRTRNRQGKISRTARVYSNDPAKSIVRLGITALIRPIIRLTTSKIYLVGKEYQSITKVVEVIPGPPQTYRGFLKIKTNYPEKPEITILIKGRFLKKTHEQ